MEVDFEIMKEQLASTLDDVVKNDPPRYQRESFKELEESARIMCDIFRLITRDEAIELRQMVKEARKRTKSKKE